MAFEVDGLIPASVLQPETVDDLGSVLRDLNAEKKAVIPWGGGTRMHVGNLPAAYDAAVDLSSLPVSIEHVAGDMVCIVSANITVDAVNKELATAGQRLPFDVPNPAKATIGGTLATNAAGRMRSSFGGMRDWVIGMKVMQPDGSIAKSGGRVVKNVQGFDLHRLNTGAFGTLGIIVEAGFKLVPTAVSQTTVAAWFEDLSSARQFAMSVFNGPSTPEAITLAYGDRASAVGDALGARSTGCIVLVQAAGSEAAVERMVNDATGLAGASGAVDYQAVEPSQETAAWDSAESATAQYPLELRAALRPTAAFEFLGQLERRTQPIAGSAMGAALDVGFGALHIGFNGADDDGLGSTVDTAKQLAREFEISLTFERLPLDLKKKTDVFSLLGANMEVMRRLKQQFDPNGTLNRGRFAGGI